MVLLELRKIESPSPLSEEAYRAIKESLLSTDLSQLTDEQRLDERELSEQLGVSRTPVREAISRLVIEGFLKVVPRKGVYVVRKSKRKMIEILLTRAALEGMAVRLATENVNSEDIEVLKDIILSFDPSDLKNQFLRYSDADIKFHELILQISQCGTLIDLANSLFDHTRWIRFRATSFKARLGITHEEHVKIIEAMEKGDPDLAEKCMRSHVEGLARYIDEKVGFHSDEDDFE